MRIDVPTSCFDLYNCTGWVLLVSPAEWHGTPRIPAFPVADYMYTSAIQITPYRHAALLPPPVERTHPPHAMARESFVCESTLVCFKSFSNNERISPFVERVHLARSCPCEQARTAAAVHHRRRRPRPRPPLFPRPLPLFLPPPLPSL